MSIPSNLHAACLLDGAPGNVFFQNAGFVSAAREGGQPAGAWDLTLVQAIDAFESVTLAQATTSTAGAASFTVISIRPSDEVVRIRCYNSAGALVDANIYVTVWQMPID